MYSCVTIRNCENKRKGKNGEGDRVSWVSCRRMPAAGATVPAVAEGAGQLEDLDEPPEPRVRGGSGRTGLMKPLVVLALPGMYLFYKYSQYRREQRELSRRRVTERELQHLHHKIVSEFLVSPGELSRRQVRELACLLARSLASDGSRD